MASTFMAPNFNAGSGASFGVLGAADAISNVCYQHRSSASAPSEADARTLAASSGATNEVEWGVGVPGVHRETVP